MKTKTTRKMKLMKVLKRYRLPIGDSTRPDSGKENCPLTGRTLQQDNAQWQIRVFPPTSVFSCLLSFSFFQRILSCKKVGSILREARDRVVSLAADARSGVIACHVSDADVFSSSGNTTQPAERVTCTRVTPEKNHQVFVSSGERFHPGGLQSAARSRSAAENEKEGEESPEEGGPVSSGVSK